MRRGYIPNLHEQYVLEGTPYEIGVQRGKLTTESEKKKFLNFVYSGQYTPVEIPLEQYNLETYKQKYPKYAAEWEKMIEALPEWAIQEMHGLADSAHLPYDKVLLHEVPIVFPEAVGDVSSVQPGAEIEEAGGDCTAFVAYGKGADGGPFLGGNAEGAHNLRKNLSIVYIKNKTGNNMLTISRGSPGATIRNNFAMNDKGVCLWSNGISPLKSEYGIVGIDGLNTRMALNDCNNVDEVLDFYKNLKRLNAKNRYVVDTKRGVHIEYTANHINFNESERGFEPGSSPVFKTPKMRQYNSYLVDEFDRRFSYAVASKRTDFRLERYEELFKELKPLTAAKCVRLLADHGGRGANADLGGPYEGASDYTICAHGKAIGDSYHCHHRSTVAVPAKKTIYVAMGSACETEFIAFKVPSK